MSRAAEDQVIEAMLGALGERLAPAGWRRRPIDRPGSGTFTRAIDNGVIATLQVSRAGIVFPGGWPVRLRVVPGVGHEAALALWPLLGRRPYAAVLWDWSAGGANGTDIEFDGEPGVTAFLDRVVVVVDGPARAFAESFPDIDALIAAERPERPVDPPPADAPPREARGPSMADLVLVLAVGRLDEARSMLVEVDSEHADPGLDPRFARQVRRRLEAGAPEVPRLEETLAVLPRAEASKSSSWSTTRAEGSARQAARDAVRGRADGETAEALIEDLAAEYAQRGLPVRRLQLAVTAEDILVSRRPLGRAQSFLQKARVVGSGGKMLVDHVRKRGEQDPEWMRPPDRATYPLVDHQLAGDALVHLDPGVEDLLGRTYAGALHRFELGALVQVWFSREPAGVDDRPVVVVHIGENRVGVVPADRAGDFDEIFRAAALFDEDPVARALLARPGGHTWYLDYQAASTPR